MIEKELEISGIDPVLLLGIKNAKLPLIISCFPCLRIISRGNILKAIGEEKEVDRFIDRIRLLIEYIKRFDYPADDKIKEILLEDDNSADLDEVKEERRIIFYGKDGRPVRLLTPNQRVMYEKYLRNDLIFAIGPAGTGKTYTAIALGMRSLKNREVKKLILSRPAVEAGEHLGFLPGDMKEKIDPYLQPLYDALYDMMPFKKLSTYLEEQIIEVAPLAYMRGRTLENSFVILDEAQNTTLRQLKMFLTRMGKNSKFIVTGDITQVDLPDRKTSGLIQAVEIFKNIEGIAFVNFDERDIIRHKLVKLIIKAFEKYEP